MTMTRLSTKARFVPNLEALENRLTPACSITESGGVMTITGLSLPTPGGVISANHIVISDNGSFPGKITVTCDGAAPHTNAGFVNVIVVNAQDGNDQVEYTYLPGAAGFPRTLYADLGNGNDEFLGLISSPLVAANLTITALGQQGNDALRVATAAMTSAGPLPMNVRIAPNKTVNVSLDGGIDNDVAFLAYRGVLNGNLLMNVNGNAGQDSLFANVNLLAGSNGHLGTSAAVAKVTGGADNDEVSFLVKKAGTPVINARLDGGLGIDRALRTNYVVGVGSETNQVLNPDAQLITADIDPSVLLSSAQLQAQVASALQAFSLTIDNSALGQHFRISNWRLDSLTWPRAAVSLHADVRYWASVAGHTLWSVSGNARITGQLVVRVTFQGQNVQKAIVNFGNARIVELNISRVPNWLDRNITSKIKDKPVATVTTLLQALLN
jgi:hypothetical protein